MDEHTEKFVLNSSESSSLTHRFSKKPFRCTATTKLLLGFYEVSLSQKANLAIISKEIMLDRKELEEGKSWRSGTVSAEPHRWNSGENRGTTTGVRSKEMRAEERAAGTTARSSVPSRELPWSIPTTLPRSQDEAAVKVEGKEQAAHAVDQGLCCMMLQSSKSMSFCGCWQGSDQQILDLLFSMAKGHGLPQGEKINLLH
ncbi:hypothetical protein Nmel_004818 [Mimus melanotis]